jgi:2'-5' RNA ligase
MNTLRTFIALEIPPAIQKAIAFQVSRLQTLPGNGAVRWVSPGNIHLTLKFLGDVSPSNLDLLKQMLANEASLHPGFAIQVGTLGCFPNLRRPRTLWVGLTAPRELASLQRGIEHATARLGYTPEDRAFSPHLTIGRVREQATSIELQSLRAMLEQEKFGELGASHIGAIHLFKSELKPGGSIYTRLYTANLAS